MKVAIACEKGLVSGHFGHSDSFEVYTLENNMPVFVESLKSPVHTHGSLPAFLKDANIDVVICGGIGQGAVQLMLQDGIDVLSGASGFTDEVIDKYAKGKLISKDVQCSGHDHDHECHHD